MKRSVLLSAALLSFIMAAPSIAEDGTYGAFRAGVFLPNSKGDATQQGGMSNFDAGYNMELAIGFRPASYAAIEIGTGFYSSSRDTQNAALGQSEKLNAYGVPVTATAKGILSSGPFEFFAGAGIGYYFSLLEREATSGGITTNKSFHGNALGYHLVGGADYSLNERIALGAEIKWMSTRPDMDDFSGTGKKKWEFGGTAMNVGVKYKF